jgi:hypothetical protein
MNRCAIVIVVCLVSLAATPTFAAGVEDAFDADVYPSASSAARSLAGRWMRESSKPPTEVSLDASGVPENVREAVAAAFSSHLPADRIHWNPGGRAPVRVTWGHLAGDRHRLALGAFSTEVVDKPWVHDAAAVRQRGSNDIILIARSNGPDVDAAAATESARRSAALSLLPPLRARLKQRSGEFPSESELNKRLLAELSLRPEWTADRFVQRFERPYGTLWQESLLISVPRDHLNAIASDILARARNERQGHARAVTSVLAILVAIWLLYLLANVLTRGYFVWKLRVAMTIIAIGVGLAAVLWVAA